MGWARFAMERLQAGETVTIKPHGNSMRGKVESGDEVLLAPCPQEQLQVGDIVLVRVAGNIFLHLIKAMDARRVQIGNNRGKINGWAHKSKVFGVAVEVAGREVRERPRPL